VIPVRLGEIDSATLVRGDPASAITSIVSDSRAARPDALFVCLHGRRRDGHEFAADATDRGATAALCARGRAACFPRGAVLEADDPLAALGRIAGVVRDRSRARVVGVVGSAGKTSAKDALRALLAPHLTTVASPASYNNELGVPLTLSLLEQETAVCECEVGTGAPGELEQLCRIVQPDVGVITAIGPEHLEFFGTVEGVAAEEAALISALPSGAPLVVPEDADLLAPYRRDDLDEWRFGLHESADVRPVTWRRRADATDAAFLVRGERIAFATNLSLLHHRLTLAAAVAAAAALGLPLDRIAEGAAAIALSPYRGEERRLAHGVLLINDAYNANPVSVAAALEAVSARRNGGRAVAVLGEMAELGPDTLHWHACVGRQAATLGVDLLVAVGPAARAYVDGAGEHVECCWFPDVSSAARSLPSLLRPDDVVLLKGSRSAQLERLAQALERQRVA
jgi:UDP-N-acetylmuramoyl-tripeptide--D-alanyl-D-alanine ligase